MRELGGMRGGPTGEEDQGALIDPTRWDEGGGVTGGALGGRYGRAHSTPGIGGKDNG